MDLATLFTTAAADVKTELLAVAAIGIAVSMVPWGVQRAKAIFKTTSK